MAVPRSLPGNTAMFDLGPALPTLLTERLVIRSLTAADLPDLFAIFSDPIVTRYMNSPTLARLGPAAELLAQVEDVFRTATLFQWGVARRTDDAVIGNCTLAS